RRDTTAVGVGDLENTVIAERLETLAALLDLAGAGHYSVRAYRRAAELVRATPAPVADLVRSGRVRELRGIGPAIEARLRELVETGRIAEIDELEGEVQPELVGLGRLVGLAPQRMVQLGKALGIGPATEAKIRAALARPRPLPRRALMLNRAWALAEAVARPLGGEVAGDPRRWCDSSERLAVVVASAEPAAVLDRFATLPEIVSVVERETERALGVTVEGVPVELVVAAPDRFGTELLRATGSEEYVAALGELPTAPDEQSVYAALALAYLPPELREHPF